MPDLAEVSGGERSEHDPKTSLNARNNQKEEGKAAFPSLSDVFLEKMKLFPGRKDKTKIRLVCQISHSYILSSTCLSVRPSVSLIMELCACWHLEGVIMSSQH